MEKWEAVTIQQTSDIHRRSERINALPTHPPEGIPFNKAPNSNLPWQYRSRGPGVVGQLPKVRNELAAGPPRCLFSDPSII